MLILSRKVNESIVIGDRIVIRILRIGKDAVKLGIEAPLECRVHREELLARPPKPGPGSAPAQPGDAANP
jgi:carbon storage regulator